MGHRPLGELGVEYSVDRLEDPAETEAMPHGIFECQPCIGKRIITLTVEENACTPSFSASHSQPYCGDAPSPGTCRSNRTTSYHVSSLGIRITFAHAWTDGVKNVCLREARVRLDATIRCLPRHVDAFGIHGGWDSDGPDRKYLRVLKQMDVSEEDTVSRFVDMVGDAVTDDWANE